MVYSQILLSLILIITGYLVKKYPELIAGYNTLPKDKKAKIDIVSLSNFLKRLLIGLGVFCIINYAILTMCLISDSTIMYCNTIIIVLVVIVGLIMINKRFKL